MVREAPVTARRQMRLKELAQELGLSIPTVSRALGGYSDISEATRARVKEAAERLGYVPSRAGRMLVSGRSDFIGMLLQVRDHQMLDASLGEFVAGLSEGFALEGKDLFIATVTASQSDLDVLTHIVDGQRADAMVLNRTMVNDERVSYLLDRNFTFVTHGRASGEKRPYAWVDTDSEGAFALAVERLVALGHRRFALMGSEEPFNFSHIRRRAMEAALNEHGLALLPERVAAPRLTAPDRFLAEAMRLLSLPERPTAILCVTDALALAVLEAARLKGLSVPKDLSVIGFNNIPVAAYSDPPLSTFDQEAQRAAGLVARMTLELIERGPAALGHHLIKPGFIERASHGPAPAG